MFRNPFDLIIDRGLINPYYVYKSIIESWKDNLSNEDRINGTRILILCDDVKSMFHYIGSLCLIISHESEYKLKINKETLNINHCNIELTYSDEDLKYTKCLDINIKPVDVVNSYNMRGYRFSSIIIDTNEHETFDYEKICNTFLPLIAPTENKPFKKLILMYRSE